MPRKYHFVHFSLLMTTPYQLIESCLLMAKSHVCLRSQKRVLIHCCAKFSAMKEQQKKEMAWYHLPTQHTTVWVGPQQLKSDGNVHDQEDSVWAISFFLLFSAQYGLFSFPLFITTAFFFPHLEVVEKKSIRTVHKIYGRELQNCGGYLTTIAILYQ